MDSVKMAAALKEIYAVDGIVDLTTQASTFQKIIKYKNDFGGDVLPIPVKLSGPQGNSASFNKAQVNRKASNIKSFNLTQKDHYGTAVFSHKVALQTQRDDYAFAEALKLECDGIFETVGKQMAVGLMSDGTGKLGTISAVTSTTITISAEDALKLDVGMTLDVFSAAGSQIAGIELEVTKVNKATGVITCTGIDTDDVLATQYIVLSGTHRGSSYIQGVLAWVPWLAPEAGDNFNGVDRSVAPELLAGARFNGAALPLKEALIKGLSYFAKVNDNPKFDYLLVSHNTFADLDIALGGQVRYNDAGNGKLGFSSIDMNTPNGVVKVVAETYLSDEFAVAIDSKTWEFHCLMPDASKDVETPIHIMNMDGNDLRALSSSADYEIRIAYFGDLACLNTRKNGIIKIK